ncbi:alkaline phosphatase D family protein [Chitinimonas sp. BJB300]|uniref:alkaline phosphatase D family protein n=1 Tax=Chitinimonas sp. BJB300 TaxID=1559339 RepID=UPI000C0D7DD6|nr:alkaline phosphatase D family protein [Chitinimonas sp. BJB300]PHV11175.1 phosphodiesterase [Chitinimonas sp. BJB300]TSJ87423.1 phosphodiesterase [Chitinimonas sp. BJB300]
MDRRQFLKAGGFITASVAGLGLFGCNSSSDNATTSPEAARGEDWQFPQSIASGDPRPDGIMLWTRVILANTDPVASNNQADFSIRLQISEADHTAALGGKTALAGGLVLDTTLPVFAEFDHTVRHKVTGLAPGKTYYYQFIAGDSVSNVGRFKTAPAKDADIDQLKFAFLSCQDWSINHWGAYAHIAANDNLDFIVHLGDYIYETVGEAFQLGAVESRHDALQLPDGTFKEGASGAKYATSLADYRYLYKKYRTDSRLQAVHERFAFIAVWDDHEFSDDCWNDAQTYSNGVASVAGGDNEHQPNRRRSASRAWYEFMPADIYFSSSQDEGIFNIRIYRELQFGKLAHLVMTDERLYRSDHLIPEASINPATGTALGRIGSRYLVPQDTLSLVETLKMASGRAQGDELAHVSILGKTQRDWWKKTMQGSPATWKLWGNEVTLLRMGVDGNQAIAMLVALNVIPTMADNIATTATTIGGNQVVAAAIVAAVAAGANNTIAAAGAVTIATADATSSDKHAAAIGAGLSAQQAGLAVGVFDVVKTAASAGATAAQQQQAGALRIAEGLTGQTGANAVFAAIQADIVAKKQASAFVPAGMRTSLTPFFTKFLLNADQWDGFNAERKALMTHLSSNHIQNVVALTGDIHAFYVGAVHNDYDAGSASVPVMVDLVTAGVSSDSFFNYLKDAVSGVSSSLATLVFYPLSVPVAGLGTLTLNMNLLDHTLRKSTVTAATLAESLRVSLRSALGGKGVPEAQLDATTTMVLTGLQADAGFTSQLLPLAQALASLNSNPWLKLANTDAQGYAVVTLTPSTLTCEFRQVNKLVGTSAPSTIVANTVVATVQKDVAAVTLS